MKLDRRRDFGVTTTRNSCLCFPSPLQPVLEARLIKALSLVFNLSTSDSLSIKIGRTHSPFADCTIWKSIIKRYRNRFQLILNVIQFPLISSLANVECDYDDSPI